MRYMTQRVTSKYIIGTYMMGREPTYSEGVGCDGTTTGRDDEGTFLKRNDGSV